MRQRSPSRLTRKQRRAQRRDGCRKLPIFILSTALAVALPHISRAATLFWDPDGTAGPIPGGGSGVWDTTSLFWDADSGTPPNEAWVNTLPAGDDAIFSGTPGTVTLGAPIVARFLDFAVPGYQLTNGGNPANTLTLAGANAGIFLQSGTMNVGLNIEGTEGLRFGDSLNDTDGLTGTLVLSNPANTYSGVTTITAGVLETNNLPNLGQPSSIGVGGPALRDFFPGFPEFGQILNTDPYITLDGGTLRYTGTGTATSRTFTLTNLGGGIDSSGTGASLAFSTPGGGVIANGTGARTLTLSGTNIAFNNIASPITNSTEPDSPTSVVKTGSGTWFVTADNTYTGSTTIAGGKLIVTRIEDEGTPSSIGQGSGTPQNLVFDGGSLIYTGSTLNTPTVSRAFTIGPGGGTFESSANQPLIFSNPVSAAATGAGDRSFTLGGTTAGNVMRVQIADPTTVWALDNGNRLYSFNPATPESLSPALTITGLTGGESLHSLDYRPSTGVLYALGTTNTGGTNRLYTINTTTGAATSVGTVASLTLTGGNPETTDGFYGLDFDPADEHLRLVGANGQNVRIDGPAYTAFTADPDLNPATRVVGIAFSNNVSGAASTTLYGINPTADTLVTIDPASGLVTTVGSLSGTAFAVNAGNRVGFDIASNGAAYASIFGSDNVHRLYNIDLATGTASLLGASTSPRIGSGTLQIRDISVAVSGATSLIKTGPGTWTLDRSGTTSGHTYSGNTTILQGTLGLNFNQTDTPDSQLINPQSPLVIGGGTLSITGKAGPALPASPRTNAQGFNGITILPGASVIATARATNNVIDLTLGSLATRPAYATIAFPDAPVPTPANPSTTIVHLDATNDPTGILGAWATLGGTDWAVVNAGVVEAFTGYTGVMLGGAIANGPNSHVRITDGTGSITLGAATTTIRTLNQNTTTAATINNAGQTLRLGAVGGILVGSGRQALTFGTSAGSGRLTAGGADNTPGELMLLNHSNNVLTINSVVADNGSGAVTLVNSGTGVTVLNGVNTHTGGTVLNSGTVRIGNNNALSTGSIIVHRGTTLPTLASTSGIGREIVNDVVLNGDLQFVDSVGTGGLVLRGAINLTGGERTLSVALANGYVTLDGTITNGALIKSGPGALALNDITLSSVSSITLAQGSLDLWQPDGLGTTPIFAVNGALSASGAFQSPVLTTIFVGGNLALGRPQVSDGIDLGGFIDLSNSILENPRIITTSGAFPQQQQRLSGTITSGLLAKGGSTELYVTSTTSTYEGGTLIISTPTGSSLRVSPAGRLGGNAYGNDINVVQPINPTPSVAVVANSFAILRLESLDNVQSNQSVFLNNQTNTATPFLGWGAAFDQNPGAIGFVDEFDVTLLDTGLKNIRLSNTPGFPVGIALDGVATSQDVIAKVLAGAPNANVWLGATLLGGTYTAGSLAAGADGVHRLGGGGGTLTIERANVLTGPNSLVTGSFDQTGRGITGTVFLPQAQDFIGGVTVGAGTTLVAGRNASLGTSPAPITLIGGTLNLRTTGAHSSTDTQYAGRDFIIAASSTISVDPLGGGQNGRVQIGALDFSTGIAAPSFSSNNSFNFELLVSGPITLLSNTPAALTTSVTNFFNVNSGFLRPELPIGQTPTTSPGANFTKQGGGTLILTQPSTFTGITTANGGTFVLAHPAAASSALRLQSGTLSLRSDSPTPVDYTFTNLSLTGGANGNGTIFVGPFAPNGVASYASPTIRIAELTAGTQRALTIAGSLNASLQVVGSFSLGADFTLTVNSARTELLGGIAGAFDFTKAGIGSLTISGTNLAAGNTTVTQGTLIANHDNGSGVVDAFGAGTLGFSGTLSGGILVAGSRTLAKNLALNSNGGAQVLGGLDAGNKTFSGDIAITANTNPDTGQPNNTGITFTAEAGSTVNFTGTISGGTGGNITIGSPSGNVLVPIAGTAALGRGTIVFNPPSGTGNTFTRPLIVNNGTLVGKAQATSGSPFGTNGAVTLNQATLQLDGRASTTNTVSAGAFTVGGGAQLVINDPNDAFTTQFTVGSLTRTGNGTLALVPALATGQERFSITAAPTLINGILAPWLVRTASDANRAGDFATMSGGNVVTATYTGTNINAPIGQVINDTDGGTLTDHRAAYALRLGGALNLGGRVLSIGDVSSTTGMGGLILNAGAGLSNGALAFGLAEGLVYVDSAATSTIGAAITGTGTVSLTKFGEGTLTLGSGANTYRGTTTIGRGTLRMGAANALGRWQNNGAQLATAVTVHSNGVLDLNGFDTEIGSLAGGFGAVVDVGNNRLTVGRTSAGTTTYTFSGQILGTGASVLHKIGPGTLVLDNTRADANASTFSGSILIDQGGLTIVVADQTNGSPFAVGNSLADVSTITLRGGVLNLRSSGDNVSASNQNLVAGYNIVVGDGNSILDTNRFHTTETQKTLELGTLTLGRNDLATNGGNAIVPAFMGTVTLTTNGRLNINSSELSISGKITDNGAGYTLGKVGGQNLFINNADNDYSGGTVIGGGNLFFGARGPDVLRFPGNNFIPSDSARAGTGPIVLQTNTVINLTDPGNLAPGQTVRVFGSPMASGSSSGFVIQDDRPVSDFNLRASGRGTVQIGVQHGTYYTPIDMSKIGNGEWGLTAGRGVETLYMSDTLGAGAGNVFRFHGSSGSAFVFVKENVVTGPGVVELGRALTDLGSLPGNSNAQIRFMLPQDYTGPTLIHRSANTAGVSNALLDFRGTLASGTSAANPIEVYGRLLAVGAGRFTDTAGAQVNTHVLLRPGSELALDYNNNASNATAFLVPFGATSSTGFINKWGDTQPIVLDGASLRVVSAAGSLTTEIIGAVTYKGAAEIFPQSAGTGGNSVVIINGPLTRTNLGTLAFRSNSSRLGVSGEPGTNEGQRVVFSTAAHAVASGVFRGVVASGSAAGTVVPMVSPRFYSNTANTFVDYAGNYVGDVFNPNNFQPTTVLGFSDVPFRSINSATFNSGGLNNGTEIIDHGTTNVTTVGTGIDIWAFQTNVDVGSSSTTNPITIRSGGLAVRDAGVIFTPLIFRNGATAAQNVEADIWAITGTIELRGSVTAQNLVKTGAGTLVLAANNTGTLAGSIQINGGALQLGGLNATGTAVNAAQALGGVTSLRLHAGNFNNAGNQMPQVNLRSDVAATYSQSITVSEFVPLATLNVDRVSTTGTNQGLTVAGGLTIEGGGSAGTVLSFTNGNDFDFTSSGPTVLGLAGNTAPIGINVQNNNGTNNVVFSGVVSGPAPMVKSGNGPLTLTNTANTFTGGITINDGTVELRSVAAGTGRTAGAGAIVLNRGTLRVSTDTAGAVNLASQAGNHLTVRGPSVLLFDRVGTATTNSLPTIGGDSADFTTQGSPIIQVNSGGNIAGGAWAGRTVIDDSPTFNVLGTLLQLGNNSGSDSLSGTGHIYKSGRSALVLNNNEEATLSGGIDIFEGQVRTLTNVANAFGTGPIRISPAGSLGVLNVANVTSYTQIANFHSNSTALAGLAFRANGLDVDSFLDSANITTAPGNGGLLAIDTTVTNANSISQAALFDGYWFLGATTGGTYQAALTAGAENTYRIGGGGATLTLNTTSNMLTGANKAIFGQPNALAGNGAVVIQVGNNFSGGSQISRVRDIAGNISVSQVNMQQGFIVSPLGSGPVEVHGNLVIEAANGSAASISGGNANVFTFHPGARLLFSNTTLYGGTSGTIGRWDDGVGIALRSSSLELAGNAGVSDYNAEVVGAVTFSGGSELRVARGGTGTAAKISTTSLARVGTGTLTLVHTGGRLGADIFENNNGADLVAIDDSSAILDTNQVVKPFIVSRSDNRFVFYDGAVNSLRTLDSTTASSIGVPYLVNTVAAGFTLSPNDGSAILEQNAAAATLGENIDVYALRLQEDLSPSANGLANTVTIRSGGLTLGSASRTIHADLIFGTASTPAEALIHASSAVLTINSRITASAITKFGTNSLVINQDQPGIGPSEAWNLNQGQLIVQTPGGLGTAPVNLNGWTGNTGQTVTELRFNHNPGTPDELVFTSGKITSLNMNLIRAQVANDRTVRIAGIDMKTTNAVPGTGVPGLLWLRVDAARSFMRTGALTMFDDYVVQVDATSFGPGSTSGVQPDAIDNAGAYHLTKIGDGVLILGDNAATFTGSGRTFTVNEGAVKVLANGSLGGAGTEAIIDNGGALEIATPGFTPVGTLTQRRGSIERWSVNGARSGTVNLPAGVHLQIAANQTGTQTINLDGGSIMGYLPLDIDSQAVFHHLGSNVSVNLVSDSMLGQPYPAGVNVATNNATHLYYDMGKGNQLNNPLNPVLFGSVLDIRGSISGADRTLTKVGLDLIQLSGTNSGFNTTVREGTLVLGSAGALPADKTLTMAGNGTLDLNGFNASTATLAGESPQSVIMNSATTVQSLTVNGGTSYTGGLSGSLGFIKSGAADFTLGGTLTHSGPTTTMTGTLALTGSATGTTTFKVNGGANFDVSGAAGGFQLIHGQTLLGGVGATAGTVMGSVTAKEGSIISPGFELGQTGILTLSSGNLTLESDATFKLELAGNVAGTGYDQLVVNNGAVNLGGATLDASVAFGSVLPGEVYYIVLHNTGATTGTFAGLPQLSFLSISGYEFQINYAADASMGAAGFNSGAGNDVALLVTVPEPGSLAGLSAGLGVLLGLRRFRRRG